MSKTLQQSDGLITFDIKIDGSRISDVIEVQEISIDMQINRISSATIIVQDGGAMGLENAPFENSDGKLFIPGVDVEISLGYDGKRKTAFKGVVIGQRLKIVNSESQLQIVCRDKAYLMTKGRYNAIYRDKTDADTIKALVNNHAGVSLDIDALSIEVPEMMQYNCSDWDFIVMRAEANNMIVSTHQNKLSVKKIDFSKEPEFEINAAQFVKDVDLHLSGDQVIAGVDLTSWDSNEQKEETQNINISDTLAQGNLSAKKIASGVGAKNTSVYSSAPLSKEEMKLLGDAIVSKSVLSKIEGTLVVPGTIAIVAGDIIKLSDLSARFNGKAFVTRVLHQLDDGEWFTTLFIGAPSSFHASKSDVADFPASGILPASNGLQIGKVLKIHEDPANNNRVQIALSSFTGTGQKEGIWARIAFPYASNEAGFFFYPEVGDEVLVTFLNNDPRFPVITGAMYNGKNVAKEIPDEKNQFKSIYSKSGINIRFDDEDKILTIATPGENKITLNDKEKTIIVEDLNKNKITMSESGIELDSPKDIKITSKADVSIKATGNIALEATGDLTGKGMNVTFTGQTGFTAKGNATAELSGGGQTTVKGAMVMIN